MRRQVHFCCASIVSAARGCLHATHTPAGWMFANADANANANAEHRRLCVIELSLLVHEAEHSNEVTPQEDVARRFMMERCVS